ncbi:uncharacterized protein ACOB8E_023690 [Sarcophilus harrisii]
MTLGDLHPLYTPRPYRIYVFTLEGTHTEATTISNGDRQYSLDPEEREKVTLEGRLMTQLVQKGKKTAIQETFPKVKEMSLNVPNRFHGCWMICQEGKNLNTFKKLQATYQQQLLKQRELTPDAENTDSKTWKESIKTTSLISNEEVIGAASKNLSPDEKRRNLSAHDLVRFGSRTLVGARIAREEDMGAVRAKKEKENKAIILTHNLVRFSSRTIVGAIKASAVTEWEEVSETQDEKKGVYPGPVASEAELTPEASTSIPKSELTEIQPSKDHKGQLPSDQRSPKTGASRSRSAGLGLAAQGDWEAAGHDRSPVPLPKWGLGDRPQHVVYTSTGALAVLSALDQHAAQE